MKPNFDEIKVISLMRKRRVLNHHHAESRVTELLYDWRFTANQFVLASRSMRLTTRLFFFCN
jgi:hypothetical protein